MEARIAFRSLGYPAEVRGDTYAHARVRRSESLRLPYLALTFLPPLQVVLQPRQQHLSPSNPLTLPTSQDASRCPPRPPRIRASSRLGSGPPAEGVRYLVHLQSVPHRRRRVQHLSSRRKAGLTVLHTSQRAAISARTRLSRRQPPGRPSRVASTSLSSSHSIFFFPRRCAS